MIFFIIITLIYLILIFYIHKYLLNNYENDDNDKENETVEINDQEIVNKDELKEFIDNI